jgi:hypothetical protein
MESLGALLWVPQINNMDEYLVRMPLANTVCYLISD